MKQTEEMNEKLDWYGMLLTEKQQNICDMYYREDYSLSEISENLNISRAAVQDALKKSEKIMDELEEKLQLIKKYHARLKIYDKIKELKIEQANLLVSQLEDIE